MYLRLPLPTPGETEKKYEAAVEELALVQKTKNQPM